MYAASTTPVVRLHLDRCLPCSFERGSKDIFKLSFIDIGELAHVLVKKDNRTLGLGGDWHLQSVEVFHPGGYRYTRGGSAKLGPALQQTP